MSRKPPGTRADYCAFYPIATRWKDMDAYGHLNNAAYLSFLDTAVTLWQLDAGMEIERPGGLRFLAAQNGCTYHAEARFPDLLHAGVRCGHLGNSSARFEVGFFRNDDQTACAEGFILHVAVNPQTRPERIPDRFRPAIEEILRLG
ncbi:acyl-CoA thioesterase [Salipiger mangrovisoli]|uniref:Acyl-CoA thioesterase n=1 Tax=Salipiger mangrovisoli TaxID=2865933 RepID=A0ABR9X1J1_9RHOB|nr:acyl-CoA thioesterase [Salipiger mangrovisoli]MBE9637403.1 acyl-CoA thioesterase [Salipiger mangrovisoli]